MYVDATLLFSDAQAITAAAASTSHVDAKAARNLGAGRDLYVVVTVDVAFTDASSDSTLTVALQGDSSDSFSPDGSQELFIIPALAAVGDKFVAKISPDYASNYRYLQLYYTPNNGNLSTGSVTAFITVDAPSYVNFAKNYEIS